MAIGAAIVLSVIAYMAYLGASSSWQYYLTVDECIAQASTLHHSPIRVSGEVAAGSLRMAPNGSAVAFVLAGSAGNLTVSCASPVPDNLAEGRQVVVEGRLKNCRLLESNKVLTRCASKYSSESPVKCSQPVLTTDQAEVD
jgi:cytochrome c-type biogenesis protein CcmE